MSILCGRCNIMFENKEAKKLHFIEDARAVSYDLNMQEHIYGCYVRCMDYQELSQYYQRNEQKVYCLKHGAALRMKADRAYITKDELQEILIPYDLRADEIIRQMPETSIRGNRYRPEGIEKSKALSVAKALWLESGE